ncbi:MAG TPA: hypothetical protein DEV93_14245 [Chloroflexi bacterium]|nr:hypothetical protein [Chloroflexota bacterium]
MTDYGATDYGANIWRATKHVSHASLDRWSVDSAFKSRCPRCSTGILLVYRNQKTLALQRADCCIRCGQRFHYTDESIGGEPFEPQEKETQ